MYLIKKVSNTVIYYRMHTRIQQQYLKPVACSRVSAFDGAKKTFFVFGHKPHRTNRFDCEQKRQNSLQQTYYKIYL